MLKQIFETEKILPAVTLADPAQALDTAKAIHAGGIGVMEITFRTSATIESITAIRKGLSQMQIGAGTILYKEQLHQAKQTGAQFGLSPGFNPTVAAEALKIDFPFIPGVMTPSEIEAALEMGYKVLKLFPAAQMGGTDYLKTLAGPYGHTGITFIPMGGVSLDNMTSYLSLKNVITVGGSWLATPQLIAEGNFETIRQNVAHATAVINPD